jgi:hypothetical protein
VQLELLFVSNCVFLELEDKFVQVQLELLFVSSCVFLELEDKFVQVQLELLFVSSCFFLELEDKFVQVQLELLFVSSCVFLELEDKFVQVQLELELLDVSSFVIQKQISPLGCALLHNTKTNLWWVFGSQFLSLNMGNHQIRERKSSRKKKPIEKVEEEREKEKLRMSKRRLSEEGNPISSGIDVAIVSPPSPEEKHKSSLERNPNNISSRQLFVDDQMMEDLLGADYTMDEIREATGVQHCGEEGHVVQSLVGQSNVPETRQSHVHSPPTVDPSVIEGERTATLLTPQQGGQESRIGVHRPYLD